MTQLRLVSPTEPNFPPLKKIFIVAWAASGGVCSAHEESATAFRGAAKYLFNYHMSDLEKTDEKVGETCENHDNACECDCHAECVCTPDDDICECAGPMNCEQCAQLHFNGKEKAQELRSLYAREQYEEFVDQWNQFWSCLYEFDPAKDEDHHFELTVFEQTVLP